MTSLKGLLSALAVMASMVYAEIDLGTGSEMGPAAFMWPKDRVWSAAADNTAPCGSVAGPGNRSEYPLTNAKIALVVQDESYDVELSISYLDDPKSNSDFSTLIDAERFKELDRGHTCIPVPDVPSSASAGSNATLQIKYIADFDSPENQTFYACADIQFVALTDLKEGVPCFNQTTSGDDDDDDPHHDDDDDNDDDDDAQGSNSSSGKSKSGGGLSGGAIAGIVVGVVAGVGLLALAAALFYRSKSRRAAAASQQQTARGVAWEDQPPKNSQSEQSVRMNNL